MNLPELDIYTPVLISCELVSQVLFPQLFCLLQRQSGLERQKTKTKWDQNKTPRTKKNCRCYAVGLTLSNEVQYNSKKIITRHRSIFYTVLDSLEELQVEYPQHISVSCITTVYMVFRYSLFQHYVFLYPAFGDGS